MTRFTATMTYDIVTPESAEHGDFAESGFWMPGGWTYPEPADPDARKEWLNDDYTATYEDLTDLAECAIFDGFTVEEGCSWLVLQGEHLMDETEDGDAGTMTRNLHRGEHLTDEEWSLVRFWVQTGQTTDFTTVGACKRGKRYSRRGVPVLCLRRGVFKTYEKPRRVFRLPADALVEVS